MRRGLPWPATLALLACAGEPAPREALDLVPPDAAVVAQLDVPGLIRSPMLRKHLAREIDALTRSCGYDPLPKVQRVTVAMLPQGALDGEFAAVIEGPLDRKRLKECAERLARQRGERLESLVWSGATVLRRPGGEGAIAMLDDAPGLVLVGEAHLVRAMLRQGRIGGRSIREAKDVTDLLSALGAERALRVVVRPTEALRSEARQHLVPPLVPLAEVRVLGLGIGIGARLDVSLRARMPEGAGARRLAATLDAAVTRAEKEPLLDLTSFGGPLRSFAVEVQGRDVVAVMSVTERQLEAMAADLEAAGAPEAQQ